ncbi:hypothetical protein QJQ45_014605, partial [Haematococcus lacustris]
MRLRTPTASGFRRLRPALAKPTRVPVRAIREASHVDEVLIEQLSSSVNPEPGHTQSHPPPSRHTPHPHHPHQPHPQQPQQQGQQQQYGLLSGLPPHSHGHTRYSQTPPQQQHSHGHPPQSYGHTHGHTQTPPQQQHSPHPAPPQPPFPPLPSRPAASVPPLWVSERPPCPADYYDDSGGGGLASEGGTGGGAGRRRYWRASWGVPHLDGCCVDPAEVLEQVRHSLLARPRCSAVITCEEDGAALCDLLSVLILLDEDLQAVEPGSVVLFQPVLDVRRKLAAAAALHAVASHASSPQTLHARSSSRGPARAPSPGKAGLGTAGSVLPFARYLAALPEAVPHTAAAVIHARCPKLASEHPASCIAATLTMECAEMASVIASTVMAQGEGPVVEAGAEAGGSTRLRCESSPGGLVAAFRALRAVRLMVRAAGPQDILVRPLVSLERADPAPDPPAHHTPQTAPPSPPDPVLAEQQQLHGLHVASLSPSASTSGPGSPWGAPPGSSSWSDGGEGAAGEGPGGSLMNNIVTAPGQGRPGGRTGGGAPPPADLALPPSIWALEPEVE